MLRRLIVLTGFLLFSVSTFSSARIIFSAHREDNFEIYKMNDDGSDLQRLTDNPLRDCCPRWSPDGSQIVFNRRFDEERGEQDSLIPIAPDGSSERRLTHAPHDDGFNVAWAPDSKRILFERRVEGNFHFHVIDVESGVVKRLTNNDGLTTDARWSPDGKTIVYRYEGAEGKSIYTMSANGRNARPILPPRHGPLLRFSPAWSPDGTRIVFCEMEWIQAAPEVHLVFYDTRTKRLDARKFRRGIQDVSWMGDDAVLFSMIEDASDHYDLYRYEIRSKTLTNLTNTPNLNEYNPHWVSDAVLDVSLSGKNAVHWGEIKRQRTHP